MRNKFISLMFAMLLGVIACSDPNNSDSDQTSELGSITGRAVFIGNDSHSGIVITLEKTDGLRSASVTASVGGSALARSVVSSTVTAGDGSYRFDGIVSGMYTVYATSHNSMEKAVTINVPVFPGQVSPAEELSLTLVGGLTGNVAVTGGSGNAGVLVFIASTSYMAVTDNTGDFTISNVPVNEQGYQIIAIKGNYTTVLGTLSVSAGNITDLGTFALEIPASGNAAAGIQWKGSLDSAPSNPEVNWAYYDTVQKKSFIWDGTAWRVIAQDGERGIQGEQGSAGATGGHGISIVWKGALSSAPENPQLNWAYYDIAQKASFIWDGNAWQVLSKDGNESENGNGGQVAPIFFRLIDMSAWLENQQRGNSPNDPVQIFYVGNETSTMLFNVLDTIKKYVDIDLTLSGMTDFLHGNEAGRKYIVMISFGRETIIFPGTESNPTFKYFYNLVSVTGIDVNIGAYGFAGLTNLRTVKIQRNKGLGVGAFKGCTNLSSFDMPLGTIPQNAFSGCTSLTSVYIQGGYIYEEAFSGCSNLETVYILRTEYIRARAFKDCTSLVSLVLGSEGTINMEDEYTTTILSDVFSGTARTEMTITIYIRLYALDLFQAWYKFGLNKSANYFWDLNSPYRDNLTVELRVY